ncbi:MAG: TetR/AcrR family transcriptional regulator [Lachnospiraceae bacterium]|nr:TetR/AcrR family transcriptional regulator [Lachnospiraceae bacterium]
MGNKSIQKKNYIIEKAHHVFVKKGFRSVTMKDIVEACDISRGGLYLYFDSTESIFRAVLEAESAKVDPGLARKLSDKPTNNDILTLFFYEQKKAILERRGSLLVAMYEYSFEQHENKEKTLLSNQMDASVKFLEDILKKGTEAGEFSVDDHRLMAQNIVYTLEGMKLMSRTSFLNEEDVNNQLVLIMKSILPKN